MNAIDAVKKQIADYFDAGDAAALDRLYIVLNKVMADLAIMRGILGRDTPEDVLDLADEILDLKMEDGGPSHD